MSTAAIISGRKFNSSLNMGHIGAERVRFRIFPTKPLEQQLRTSSIESTRPRRHHSPVVLAQVSIRFLRYDHSPKNLLPNNRATFPR